MVSLRLLDWTVGVILMEATYQVFTTDFQGPLEELRDAARGHDVPLSQLNLSQLISDFSVHIEDRLSWNVNHISSYLLLFSELIRLKTRILLPKEEEEDLEEEERELGSKDFFQQAADVLWDRAEFRSRLYETKPDLPETVTSGQTEYREVTLFELIKAFQKIQVTQKESAPPSIEITDEFNTVDRMEHIMARADGPDPLPFRRLLTEQPTREEIIVTFLAILQLVKQNDLRLVREVGGEQIYIIKPGNDPNE